MNKRHKWGRNMNGGSIDWYSYECVTLRHSQCDGVSCGCECHKEDDELTRVEQQE
jgi:hypothetical protein